MSEPTPPPDTPATPDGGAADSARPARRPSRLVDLIDVDTLQAIQNGFSELAGMATSIRDEQGRLVTQPSGASRFCNLVGGPLHDNEACRISNYAAAAAAAMESAFSDLPRRTASALDARMATGATAPRAIRACSTVAPLRFTVMATLTIEMASALRLPSL